MKNGKAARPLGLVSETVKASWVAEVGMITKIVNRVIVEGVIPVVWDLSLIVNCYKGNGDSVERGNYSGLELTDQILKLAEKIIYKLLTTCGHWWDAVWFILECGTTNAIFILRKLQEKYLAKNKNLCFEFVDLEKAFDWVSGNVVWWALRKRSVEEWLFKTVQSMYKNAQSRVRVNWTFSVDFMLQIRLYEGSVLSPLLFIIVLETLSKEIRSGCSE